MDDVAKLPPGLVKRDNGVYYYRRRAPVDLRHLFKNGEVPPKSLGTKDRATADERWKKERDYWDMEFKRLREEAASAPAPEPEVRRFGYRYLSPAARLRADRDYGTGSKLQEFTAQSVDQLVDKWTAEAVRGCLSRFPPNPAHEAIDLLEDDIARLRDVDAETVQTIDIVASKLLIKNGLNGFPSGGMYEHLCERLRLAMLEVARFDLARLRGEPVTVPSSASPLAETATVSAGPANGKPAKSIKQARDEFFVWKKSDKPNMKDHSLDRTVKGLDLMVEFFGAETSLSDVDVAGCEAFRQFLRDLPPNSGKIKSGLSLRQVAERARIHNERGLAPATRAGYFGTFRAMLDWAAKRKFIPFDPSATVEEAYPKGRGDGQAPRYSYTPAQLRTIVAAPLYAGCVNDEEGFNTPGPNHPRRGRFWVPLIGLFTGARLGELCQLRVNDVMVSEKGVPYIRIHAEGKGMSVKNEGAWRSLPIHPELQRIGFLDFVAQAREKGENALFPEMLVEGRSSSYRMSKLYGYFLKVIGVKVPGVVYHSFRHTTRDCHRECDIRDEISEELCGWKKNNRTSNRYGEGSSMERLYRYLCRMKYEGLDLSHLYTGAVAVKSPSPVAASEDA